MTDQILNKSKNTVIASQVKTADTFLTRFVGLLNRSSIEDCEGLIITRCSSIHMFFMRFAIDVIFVNKDFQIVGLAENIKPFQMSRIYLNSSFAIEVPVGVIQKTRTELGDNVQLVEK